MVDDEPAWVGALGAVLGKAGHRIVAAYDGDEAVRRFRSDPVDVVLLDLAMPRLDGAEVVRIIRAKSDTPIIVVTGEGGRAVPADLLDLGADDYVRKGVPSSGAAGAHPRRGPAPPRGCRISTGAGRRTARAARIVGGWDLDVRRHEIRWHAALIPATAIEFRLLAILIERLGELVAMPSCSPRAGPMCRPGPALAQATPGASARQAQCRGCAGARGRARRRLPLAGPAGPLTQVVSPVVSTASACMRRAAGTDSSR